MPSTWVYPFAMRRALCLPMEPSCLNLVLKTHLQPMGVFPRERSIRSHVWFRARPQSRLAWPSSNIQV